MLTKALRPFLVWVDMNNGNTTGGFNWENTSRKCTGSLYMILFHTCKVVLKCLWQKWECFFTKTCHNISSGHIAFVSFFNGVWACNGIRLDENKTALKKKQKQMRKQLPKTWYAVLSIFPVSCLLLSCAVSGFNIADILIIYKWVY